MEFKSVILFLILFPIILFYTSGEKVKETIGTNVTVILLLRKIFTIILSAWVRQVCLRDLIK